MGKPALVNLIHQIREVRDKLDEIVKVAEMALLNDDWEAQLMVLKKLMEANELLKGFQMKRGEK
jgi:hypothetical protein